MLIRYLLLSAWIFFCGVAVAAAQSVSPNDVIWGTSIGLFGSANVNLHKPTLSLRLLNGSTAQTLFHSSATSLTSGIALEANHQMHRYIVLTARAGYTAFGATLTANPNANATAELATSLAYLDLRPMIKFVNLIRGFEELYATAGFGFGLPLTANYNYTQQVGRTSRSANADVPSPNTKLYIPIGIGYIWKYNWYLSVIPELTYNIGLSDVSAEAIWQPWRFNTLTAGVAVTYRLPLSKSRPPKPKSDSLPFVLSVSMPNIEYEDKDGTVRPLGSLRLESAEYGEYYPLLPYIFYEVNEHGLPQSINQTINTSSVEAGLAVDTAIATDAIAINKSMLDTIGARLAAKPNANLTIVGTIDGRYETDTSIARLRAAEVAAYLTTRYGIMSERLDVSGVGLPSKPSAMSVRDGVVENRRVELSSSEPSLFEPVLVKGGLQTVAFPERVFFRPLVQSSHPVTAWELTITQADRVLRRVSSDSTNLLDSAIEWNINMSALAASSIPLEYRLEVSAGDTSVAYIGHIPVDYTSFLRRRQVEQADYVITKYSLVLFDFNSSALTPANQRVIDNLILPELGFGSTVDVYGYTDRVGEPSYNLRLSQSRAIAVKDYLLGRKPGLTVNAYGLGNSISLFDNELAVGRQLSRTVQVLVVTPK